ncbi:MAG TPA: cyclic nucleotide-binding domain-containing protein [Fimbriimonas sp.]|nr:cyclic nucleotide-binding domain-containing protein [Fimbriimonas sp.]
MKNNYIFRGLPMSVINVLAAYTTIRNFQGGETIVRQFDSGHDLVLIMEGEAVTRNFRGDVVARFGPGSIVGEMALVDGSPRSANVVTVGPTRVAIIPGSCIENLVNIEPGFGNILYHNIAKVLCRRLRTMNEKLDVPVASVR